jgi:hypothetical protein
VPDSLGHRIQFRIYALDDQLSLGNKVRLRAQISFELQIRLF